MQRLDRLDGLVTAAAAIAAIALLAWATRLAGVGLDFSDEGYYLNISHDPGLYSYSVTQFGFILNPLFRAVGWDIALFRQTGLVVTAVLAGVLVASRLHCLGLSWRQAAASGVILAPVSLMLFYPWLPTPSYNSLAFQGLLLVGIALSLMEANSRAALSGWALLGLGGWLVFMAKPTSAALLGPAVLVYLAATRRLRPWGLVIAVILAAGLLLASALAIDGSIGRFVTRLSTGSEFAAALESGHSVLSILRLDGILPSPSELMAFVASTALIAGVTWCISTNRTPLRVFGLGVVAACALAVFGIATGVVVQPFALGTYAILQICAAPIGAIIGVAIASGRAFRPPGKVILLAALFASFPYVLAFGTNNNHWTSGAKATLFWMLASFTLVTGSGVQWRAMLPGAAGALAIASILMAGGAQQPYRQTRPLQEQHTLVAVGPGDRLLAMSDDFAAYIEGLRQLARNGGFTPGTPMIDLTGHYPGALFALDAQAIGQAWMIGGYSGSNSLAKSALALVSCERIAEAWLLDEPDGRRALSMDAVLPAGLDYELVGSIMSPAGSYPQAYEQQLFRPVGDPSERRSACEAAR